MSNVPEGAQLSEDGQYWWDETNQAWNAVEGAAGSSSSSGTTPESGEAGGGGFADKFVAAMAQSGVTVSADSLPDQATLRAAIEYAQSWLDGLDPGMKAGLDAATTNDPASVVLADPSVNAAPALSGLLQAFDQAQGQPLSTLLAAALQACDAAAA